MTLEQFIEFVQTYEYSNYLRVEDPRPTGDINVIFKDWVNQEVIKKAF